MDCPKEKRSKNEIIQARSVNKKLIRGENTRLIYLIFGDPGAGKTAFATAKAINEIHGEAGRKRFSRCKNYIKRLTAQGWKFEVPKNRHVVYTSYEVEYRSPYCGKRRAYDLDPFKLGFSAKGYERAKVLPCAFIVCDEAQKYFDSHKWAKFEAHRSRFFEQHRKWGLDILLICQKDTLIDSNLRMLSVPVRIESLTSKKIEDSSVFTWTYTTWEHYRNYADGEKGKKEKYSFQGNIFDYFNTLEGEHLFLDDVSDCFDVSERKVYDLSPVGVQEYVKDNRQF